MSNTGMPVNPGLIFDAVIFKGANSNTIYDDAYQNGNAVQATCAGQRLLDTQELGLGTLSGATAVEIQWDSSVSTDFDIEFRVYKDGTYDSEQSIYIQHEEPVNDYGTTIVYLFDPKSSYRFVIDSVSNNTINLDYVKFTPIFTGTPLSSTRRVVDDYEVLEVSDRGDITQVYSSESTKGGYVQFNVEYDDIPQVDIQAYHQDFIASPITITTTGFTYISRNVDATTSSLTLSLGYKAMGSVKPPYTPTLPI
jgi:hypothetical protein